MTIDLNSLALGIIVFFVSNAHATRINKLQDWFRPMGLNPDKEYNPDTVAHGPNPPPKDKPPAT